MKMKYTIAALAATTLAANAATVATGNGAITGENSNQAGPMWGQSFTFTDAASFVYMQEMSFQASSSGSNAPGEFLHIYSSFTGTATPTASGLVAVSTGNNFGATVSALDTLTWTFDGTVLEQLSTGVEYWAVSSSSATEGTGNFVSFAYELDVAAGYTGGGATQAGAINVSAWDADFAATADTVAVPEPSSTAFLGLGGLALILRRRK